MIEENEKLINETLDNLIIISNSNMKIFFKTYKSLPFDIYIEIERLSASKSFLYKEECSKAKLIADRFHKSIK